MSDEKKPVEFGLVEGTLRVYFNDYALDADHAGFQFSEEQTQQLRDLLAENP